MLKIADILSDLTSLRVGVCGQKRMQWNEQDS
jgi:hypothetical protein